jgi:hypothetical protein
MGVEAGLTEAAFGVVGAKFAKHRLYIRVLEGHLE